MTVRLRPTGDGAHPRPVADELEGIEAFAPVAAGSPDDPFVKAFAEGRVRRNGGSAPPPVPPGTTTAGLVLAILLLIVGVAAAAVVGGESDADIATAGASSSTSTSTTSQGASTTRAVVTATPTTVVSTTTAGFAVPTTVPGATPTTRAGSPTPTTRAGTATTTATAPANQDMTISITFSPAAPVAGEPVTVTIVFADPDAPSTANCLVIEVDGATAFADPCQEPACSGSGGAAGGGVGGSATVSFERTFTSAGDHTVSASGQSVQPYCGDRFGDTASADRTVVVGPGATTSTTAPTTTPITVTP